MTEWNSQRDRRIDLVKGIALLVLVTDHLPGNVIRSVMPVSWGLADMAEAFVLMSGVLVGFGVSKLRNFVDCAYHRLRRAVILYFHYVVTAFILVSTVRYFRLGTATRTLPASLVSADCSLLFINIATLNGRVSHLCILLLYVCFALGMVALPDRVWKFSRGIFLCSIATYLGSQIFDIISLPGHLQETTYYNPFAWQLLFVTGVVYSSTLSDRRQNWRQSNYLFPVALLIQGALLLGIGLKINWAHHLINKSNLGPLRYLHAISAAVIVKEILPRDFSQRWQKLLAPLYRCSEHSLWVYCGGSLLVIALSDWMWHSESLLVMTVINLIAWAGCMIIAFLADTISARKQTSE